MVVKKNNAGVANYGYDFREQRVWRRLITGSTSSEIHYIFDQDGHLLAEHNGYTGAVLREYIWLDDKPLAVIDSTGSSKVTYFIHSGHLNEPQMMTNASKAKVWDAYVTPFGTAQVFTTGTAKVDIRLPGQWYQAEAAGSGLNQNHHRDYDPSLGRYIQVDPLGIDAGQNPYAYVDGKPYDYIDPLGLEVIATFDRTSKTLTARDVQTGETVKLTNVFSGNGEYSNNPSWEGLTGRGPLPSGEYLIGNGYDSGHGGDDWWFKLYGPDGKGGYSYNCVPVLDPNSGKKTCRGGFNLHTGRASDGCVTIYSDVANDIPGYPYSRQYNKLKYLLDRTRPFTYNGTQYKGKLRVK